MAKKATARHGKSEVPKKHYCHCKEETKPVMIKPGSKIKFRCCNDHTLDKNETVKK